MKRTRIHTLWPSWSLLAGLAVVFVGERLQGSEPNLPFLGVGGALLLAAATARGLGLLSSRPDRRFVHRLFFGTTLGAVIAVALYVLIRLAFAGEGPTLERVRGVLWALFPILLTASVLPLVAMEAAVMPVAFNDRYEESHVRRAFYRALGLALCLACLFVLNYITTTNDKKVDLSYGHQAAASEATKIAVREVTQPVKIVLFWPRANEVADTVARYFEPLIALNDNLSLERVDHALAGALAKDAGVTENGFVALIRDKSKEKFRIGSEADSARANLRRLDKSFLEALIRVSSSDKVAYFTVGHEERSWSPDQEDPRSPIKILKRQLEAWQYKVRPLGVADGLTSEIPKDAGIIFIMGPKKPFLPAETETLVRAIARGARVVITLEAENEGDSMEGLLASLGLGFDKTVLSNELRNAPLTRTIADNATIWSNKYSSHESVTTMTRSERLATLFFKAGSLVKKDPSPKDTKVDVVLRAMEDTFGDVDGNLTFDKATEKKEGWPMAAAVTRTSTSSKKNEEGRVFVISDADVFSDDLMQVSQGNAYLLRDIVLWLQLKAEPVVPTVSDADKKIEHRREEDAYLFYGTTFGLPLVIIILGLATVERRRRRS